MKKNKSSQQVEYQGRWIDSDHFRVFVYGKESQKIVNSYKEYQEALATGLWFSRKEDIPILKPKKVRADADSNS